MRARLQLFLFATLLIAPLTHAQIPAADNKLISITATGSKRFSQDAIAASTGLQLGKPVDDNEFKRASKNLADTGAFADIAYTYNYSSAGTKLEFKLVDADKFVPARFEDFVWFPDSEIQSRIKDHVPLFTGELPLTGNMADEVSDVLQAMLVEAAIPGHVEYLRAGTENGPITAISYRVTEVLIHIRNFEFPGATEPELRALQSAANKIPDREYSKSRLNFLVQHQLLSVFQARGYLKAFFGEPKPKTVQSPSDQPVNEIGPGPKNQTIVDIILPVTPGPQYKLSSLAWSGNKALESERLQKMVHAEVGQPANTIRLADDLKDIQKLYGSRGYLTVSLKAQPTFDDAASTVAVTIEVKEGPVFHMGELEFRGLDNSLTAKLRDAWKLRPGDVYDATYLDEYLPQAQKLLPPGFDWQVSHHVTANLRDKTVDVDLIYTVRATK